MEWIGWVHSGGERSILQYIGAPSRGQPLTLGESTKLGYIVGKGGQGGGYTLHHGKPRIKEGGLIEVFYSVSDKGEGTQVILYMHVFSSITNLHDNSRNR